MMLPPCDLEIPYGALTSIVESSTLVPALTWPDGASYAMSSFGVSSEIIPQTTKRVCPAQGTRFSSTLLSQRDLYSIENAPEPTKTFSGATNPVLQPSPGSLTAEMSGHDFELDITVGIDLDYSGM